ncbi:thiamine pyrophosphokinase 1-like [Antedon mediterranea]|uniref:thiamine pyrophosphokinase 1-like n=1 Tax=Antedon mediterranea TaxID=105859 RepID=UPI003AF77CCE
MSSSLTHAASIFRPLNFLEKDDVANYGLILLNQPMNDLVPRLWKQAVYKASVDGATNYLFQDQHFKDFVPDLVSGDFDSINKDVLQHYKDMGCEIVETEDQNETDFTKALNLVLHRLKEKKIEVEYIVALGALGGRLDHTLSNINTLYTAAQITSTPVYLIGQESLALLLNTGKHTIEVNTGYEAEWCGLIPVGQPCQDVTTTGLKWNLTNQKLEFGGCISTSNTFTEEQKCVTVDTDEPLLWTMGIKMK